MTDEMKKQLEDMGVIQAKPRHVPPDIVLPKKKVEYVYNDPRHPITGEVPF